MARINYPEAWGQDSRDALDAMFATARKDGLWFFHGGLSGPLWFSPDELEAEQKNEKFVWGAPNWRLRDPREHLHEARHAAERAAAERDRIADKLYAAGVR